VPEGRPGAAKLPHSPADLMLRMVNRMVDGYLDLRRVMTRQIDHWQMALLRPRAVPQLGACWMPPGAAPAG
jgi:hypothetical protein